MMTAPKLTEAHFCCLITSSVNFTRKPLANKVSIFQDQDESILITFEETLIQSALSPSTILNYLADLRTFKRWGQCDVDGEFSLLAVNQEHIRLYRYHLAQELKRAASTVNRHMMALRKFFGFAVEVGIVSTDPMQGVALVQADASSVPQPLNDEDVDKLRAAVRQGSRISLIRRDVAIIELMLHTGLRVSEVVGLQTDDIIFDHPGVRLRVGHKQDEAKARYVPLSQTIYKILQDYVTVRPQLAQTDHLFLNQRGHPLSDRTVQRIISDCSKAAALEGVSAQTLRRTFAMQLFAESNDLVLVSEQLGHQTSAITAQYLMMHELVNIKN